jgi:hypothetical protein
VAKNSRLIGMILIGVGLVLLLGCSAVSLMSSFTSTSGSMGGAVLGVVVSILVGIVPIAFGVYLLTQSRAEAAEQADMARQRKILDMVKTRGQVDIRDMIFDLKSNTEEIRDDVYKLVGMGLFTGYVNWDKGVLYSKDASQLKGNKCPNCGGEQEFVGKGVIQCKYCGAEIFL